jgi:hypothetical protein
MGTASGGKPLTEVMDSDETKQFVEFVGGVSVRDQEGRRAVVQKLIAVVGRNRAVQIPLRFSDGEGELAYVWPPPGAAVEK